MHGCTNSNTCTYKYSNHPLVLNSFQNTTNNVSDNPCAVLNRQSRFFKACFWMKALGPIISPPTTETSNTSHQAITFNHVSKHPNVINYHTSNLYFFGFSETVTLINPNKLGTYQSNHLETLKWCPVYICTVFWQGVLALIETCFVTKKDYDIKQSGNKNASLYSLNSARINFIKWQASTWSSFCCNILGKGFFRW